MSRIARFICDELICNDSGTVPLEYGLIAAIVSIAVLVSVGGFANGFQNTYGLLTNTISH